MAKWLVGKGLTDYVTYLKKLNSVSDKVIGEAIYEMAKVVADRVRDNIEALPTVTNAANIAMYKQGRSKLSDEEKDGLLEGFGVSAMQNDNGYVNVKLGFDGYNSVKTKKYPKGQPNALIARITESGSTYRAKTPFIRPAVSSTKKQAEQAGRIKIDEQIKAIPQK